MRFYDLHISSNAKPRILMRNHKKIDSKLLVEIYIYIKNPKWVYNS